ncbi:hypothetical protein HAX54_024901 [Datura stramonium]|uniref:Cystatin domain-containing protein n=1 Tax=Datura stramonium TaxID=4076 RepID=A0ABS8S6S4_DATST|nr:hypothetical protein [Datura stramonium]
MAIKFNRILAGALGAVVIASFFLHASASLGGGKGGLLGGWTPITDTKDRHVVEIGKFAVDQHNKESESNLVFKRVVKGETQVVAGTNYRLVISAKDGGRRTGSKYLAGFGAQSRRADRSELTGSGRRRQKGAAAGAKAEALSLPGTRIGAGDKSVKMKGLLFKSKPKTPVELVRQTRDLLIYAQRNSDTRESKREEKMMELGKTIRELKSVLYGNGQSEPLSDACSQLTQEFFREDTLRLLINILPKLNLEARKDVTQVVANLQRQQVQSRLIAWCRKQTLI